MSAAGRAAVAGTVIAVFALPAALAGADSFTPVRLAITIAPVARRHAPLAITVAVSADPGVLDTATAPLRIRVKLAGECGGTFTYTPGTVLLDQQLSPQPVTGQAYAATARGAGNPSTYGVQTVCVFLQEQGDERMFASDSSDQVDVSSRCTAAAARYDGARAALVRAQRQLRRTHGRAARARQKRLVTRRGQTAGADRRGAAACGPGVPL